MRKGIPKLAALQIFEAAARHESFTRAAEELSLTQSAVCRQVAGLEAHLGVGLFQRVKKRVVLTSHGRHYAGQIRKNLDRIERDTLELMAQRGVGQILELAVVPTFASQWLIPRLPQFKALRPDVTVNLSIRTEPFLFSDSSFDAAIYFGATIWPGTQGQLLFREGPVLPVCSPALLPNGRPLTPEQLAELPLLHLSTRPDAWRDWFAQNGMGQDLQAVRGARYELFSMLASAASAGLGVALIPAIMLSSELESGRLRVAIALATAAATAQAPAHTAPQANIHAIDPAIEPYGSSVSASGYYLVAPEQSDAYLALARWLVSVAPEGAATL
jgi:LysR family glycine cleavage system transcriptional activator